MALTIDKIKNINIPINVSRKPDNYPPSTRGISLYNDSVNLYDAISLFMASAPPATFNIGEGLLGNGSVLSPLSWAGVNHTAALSGNGSVGSPLTIAQNGATAGQLLRWSGTSWVPSNETTWADTYVPLSRKITINGITKDLSQDRSWYISVSIPPQDFVPEYRTITINGVSQNLYEDREWTLNEMVYPQAGIPISTGTAWGVSIPNNSDNWNMAYSWGDHSAVGYLTSYTETDPTVPNYVKTITTTNLANWNTAYGWGNHATQGYLTSVNLNALTDVTIGTLNNGQILQYNGTTSQWENVSVTIGSGDMQKSVYDIDNDGVVDYAETIAVDVRNNSSSDTLRRGTIVYLSGSTGTHPNAVKAQANSEATSSGTFGVVINDIGPNSDGLVAAIGTLHNLDTRTGANGNPNPFTSDTLLDGDVLWLDPNTAGYVTKTKPSAPNHAVFIGVVARTHPTSGRIVYKIQNGYEIEELHNVKITSPLSNNQVLRYNDSNSLWENKTLNFQVPLTLNTTPSSGAATLAGDGTLTIPNYTLSGLGGVPTTRTLTINGTSYDLSANRSWTISTASALDDLTDVIAPSPMLNQLLRYNGTNWVNQTLSNITYSNNASGVEVSSITGAERASLLSLDGSQTVNVTNSGVELQARAVIGSSTFDAGALLTLTSNSKGLLLPRLTTDQITTNLSSATDGMILYDSTTQSFKGRANGAWGSLGSGGGGISGSGTANQIAFWSGTTALTGSAGLVWDDTTKSLTFGGGTATTVIRSYNTGATNITVNNGGHYGSRGINITGGGIGIEVIGNLGLYASNVNGAAIYAKAGFSSTNIPLGMICDRAFIANVQGFGNYIANTMLQVRGMGTSTGITFLTQQSGGTNTFTILDNGQISIGPNTPNDSAILDISSTSKGFLPPRMSTAVKSTITSPAQGLVVFDTTLNTISVYNGAIWKNLSDGTTGGVISNDQSVVVTTSTQTINFDNGINTFVTLQSSTTLTLQSTSRGTFVLRITQDATGSRFINWPANIKWSGNVAPTLTTTAGATDIITLVYDNTYYYGTYALNF